MLPLLDLPGTDPALHLANQIATVSACGGCVLLGLIIVVMEVGSFNADTRTLAAGYLLLLLAALIAILGLYLIGFLAAAIILGAVSGVAYCLVKGLFLLFRRLTLL